MDRNTIVALVLILLIWLLWPKWMELMGGKKKPVENAPSSAQTAADTTAASRAYPKSVVPPAAPSTVRNAPSAVRETPATALRATNAAPARTITISTPKYDAALTTTGAMLRRWDLKDYVQPDSTPVALLANDGRGMGFLFGPVGKETDLRQRVYSTNADRNRYTLAQGDSITLNFTYATANGRVAYKRYTFRGGRYTVGFAAGFTDSLLSERVVLTWQGEVPHAEGNFQRSARYLRAEAYLGGSLEKLQIKDKPDSSNITGQTDWVAVRNKYFLTAFAPSWTERWKVTLRGSKTGPQNVNYGWSIAPDDITRSHVKGELYLGPIDVDLLSAAGHNLVQSADLGWAIIRPISKLVYWCFVQTYRVIPNYGWVIVIFSLLIKLVLHPLTKKSYESTSKMQKLKPLMDEIREKYKGDQQRLNQEMLKLYKEHGFNPLGGCLPMLLQMPIIFAIYAVIGNNIEFRQAKFIFWITDLSIPDHIYTLPFKIPFYGSDVTVLPVLMAISMFFQQKLTITDPKQKTLVYLMPVVMLFVFNNLSSGLVLYWFMFNVLTSAHQYWLMKKKNEAENGSGAQLVPAMAAAKNPTKARRR